MITQKTIDAIFSTVRIDEVIGDFIQLKKRGVNFLGLCPFHVEKTPSFTVSPAKEIYKCFGCGKAGNTVTFLMEHEKYTYPQALVYLANKYNIEIEEDVRDDNYKSGQDELESLYIVLAYAQNFYENHLFNSEEGQHIGLAYFKQRGFEIESLKNYNLGFSPSASDIFTQEAMKNGHKEEYLIEAGLSIKVQDGKLIDRFRERVMFPILSISGRTLGFGARTLKQNADSKYINSPETKVYSKSNVIYGLFQARNAIRKNNLCYLVEGYTDVIALHQSGIENVVASLGTSLTENHVRIIKRITNNLTFIYDGDQAGLKASLRGIDIGLKEGLTIKVVPLPESEDPDSFCRNNSKIEVKEYINNKSEDFILFQSRLLFKDTENDPIRKSEGIRNIIQSIIHIPNIINQTEYIRQLSRISNVSEETLNREFRSQNRNRVLKQIDKPQTVKLVDEHQRIKQKESIFESISGEQEKKVLQLLLEYGRKEYNEQPVAEVIINNIFSSEWVNPFYKKMFDFYVIFFKENNSYPDLNMFLMHNDPDIRNIASDFINPLQNLSQNWNKRTNRNVQTEFDYTREITFCLKHFELRKYYSLKKQNLEQHKKPDITPDEQDKIQEMDKYISKRINIISRELGVAYY